MSNHFLVNKDGTINLHYESLNPAQVAALISRLQGNLDYLKSLEVDPILVLTQSAKLDRPKRRITYQLNWNAPVQVIELPDEIDDEEQDVEIPEPNVKLSEKDYETYLNLLTRMIKRSAS